MRLKVVHIVSNVGAINYGVWNSAVFGADYLKSQYNIRSCLWVCTKPARHSISNMAVLFLGNDPLNQDEVSRKAFTEGYSRDETIFISHGAWLSPTEYGHRLAKAGFKWIYVPHGMLEPWSLRQSRVKKLLYYYFCEGRYNKTATSVRAVSEQEQKNLETKLNMPVALVENGVKVPAFSQKTQDKMIFLFMARLHFKKGIVPLVKAWRAVMGDEADKTLIIAGPDEGELKNIEPFLNGNIQYAGPVYGDDKFALLRKAHYYLLPSFSEGFPTSVLEAMSFGMIPLISSGCNFDAVFHADLGYRIEPVISTITQVLLKLKVMEFDASLSLRNHEFIREHYSEECIGRKLFNLYSEMMNTEEVLPA